MEFLYYFIKGILLSEIIIFSIVFTLYLIYLMHKFVFLIFDFLGLENPIITMFNYVSKLIMNWKE